MIITKTEDHGADQTKTEWEVEWGFLLGIFLLGFPFALVFLTLALAQYLSPGFWG